jgi:hypothetical protein
MSALDILVAYKFIKILSTPWKKTDAYELGLIDDKGEVLIKRKDLKTGKQKKAFTIFHQIGWNIKKLLDKLPPTKTRLGSFAAALWLLKEELNRDDMLLERAFLDHIGLDLDLNESYGKNEIPKGEYMVRVGSDTPYDFIKAKDSINITDGKSFESILGVPLFEGIHQPTGIKVVVTDEDILRIN